MLNIKNFIRLSLLIIFSFLIFSCEDDVELTPEQIERNEILKIEKLLRDNTWGFKDLLVTVQYKSRAIPLLANVADDNGMVKPGTYDSYDIYGNNERQSIYSYAFTRDDINVDTVGNGDYSKVGGYFVINTEEIRINPITSDALRFAYNYNYGSDVFTFTTDQARSGKLVEAVNDMIIKSIITGKPGDLADVIVNKLLTNDKVSQAIETFLYDLIHGKINEITQNPEEVAEELARIVVNKLSELDWETILYDKILELLQKLQVENPEEKATELAERIAAKIQASLSQSDIYDLLLPILEDIENETLPVIVTKISEAIYSLLTQVFSEENIYNKTYPLWDEFSQVDSTTVVEVSDTLSSVVVNYFMDVDTLTERLIPFISKVEATSSLKLGELAQEIIDSVLVPIVDDINGTFPGLGLEPDWESIQPYITTVLVTIKTALIGSTIEELSGTMANAIISIMDLTIQKGFEKAIFGLQKIPAEQAASVIAAWIVNLVSIAEQPIIDFIEAKLNLITDKFDAIKIAEDLSGLIYNKLIDVLSEENLYQLILPIIEVLNDTDMEKIAELISTWLIDSGVISDNIDKEQVISTLTEILSGIIGNVDPDEATQQLVDLILNSEIVENIDGNILSKIIEIKIYQLLVSVGGDLNAIEQIELEIIKE
jgi:hypothetical protein